MTEITLLGYDDDSVKRAAQFVAQLVREGIAFRVREDIVRHPSGIASAPGYVVEVSGY